MKLRGLCNHGTFPVSAQGPVSASSPSAPNGEADCDFCREEGEDKLALINKSELCLECGRALSSVVQRTNLENLESGTDTSTLSWPDDPNISQPSPGALLGPGYASQGYS